MLVRKFCGKKNNALRSVKKLRSKGGKRFYFTRAKKTLLQNCCARKKNLILQEMCGEEERKKHFSYAGVWLDREKTFTSAGRWLCRLPSGCWLAGAVLAAAWAVHASRYLRVEKKTHC
jgi:hypothetical protein